MARRILCVVLGLILLVPAMAATAAPGVSKKVIKIGLHMPLTGAAPISSEAAERGARIYWEWLQRQDIDINGRRVEVVLSNDNYNPSQAVGACKEMVEKDKVFMLAGYMQLAGNDQVQACARYAASVGVPYVSLGGSKTGLTNLNEYFAMTMTHEAQAKKLADLLVDRFRAKSRKNGIVWMNTPNWKSTHDTFVKRMEKRGATIDYDRQISRNAGPTEAQQVVQEMSLQGIENVVLIVMPTWTLQVLNAAGTQEFEPRWATVGIGWSPDDYYVDIACRNSTGFDGARMLSPIPAFASRDRFDKNYDRAIKAVYGGGRSDGIVWLGWAASKALRDMLELPGRNLTRDRFIARAERAKGLKSGIIPPMSFKPKDHFAGERLHLLKADCGQERWMTEESFVKSF